MKKISTFLIFIVYWCCGYAAPIHDPFSRPANYQNVVETEKDDKKMNQADLKINMIYYTDAKQQRSARINGKTYSIGQFVGSNRITDIQPNKVIMSDGVTKATLTFQDSILTRSNNR